MDTRSRCHLIVNDNAAYCLCFEHTTVTVAAGRTGDCNFRLLHRKGSDTNPSDEAYAQPGIFQEPSRPACRSKGSSQVASPRSHYCASEWGTGFRAGFAQGTTMVATDFSSRPGCGDSPASPPHAVVVSLPRMQPLPIACPFSYGSSSVVGPVSQRSSIFLSSSTTHRHSFPLLIPQVDARSPRPLLSFPLLIPCFITHLRHPILNSATSLLPFLNGSSPSFWLIDSLVDIHIITTSFLTIRSISLRQ